MRNPTEKTASPHSAPDARCPPLALEQLPREEVHDPAIGVLGVRAFGEAVSFVRVDDVLDVAAKRAEALDDLIGRVLRYAGVVHALADAQRTAPAGAVPYA